jgi:hypothetical protein
MNQPVKKRCTLFFITKRINFISYRIYRQTSFDTYVKLQNNSVNTILININIKSKYCALNLIHQILIALFN